MQYLSRIEIFLRVAKLESFAGAARELGMTSSAVSKQVHNLEYELNVKLLNRTTRKVSLTEEGALFFERTRRALDDIQEAREQLNELKATPRGSLRINVPMALGDSHLKQPIADFALQYPDVLLDVSLEDRVINIIEENVDVAIRIGTPQDSALIARKLAVAPVIVCASPAYLKKNGTPKHPDDLRQYNVLAYTRNKGAHEWRFKEPTGAEGMVSLHGNFKADAASMLIEAAKRGVGIIIIPAFFVLDEIKTGKIIQILKPYKTWPERNLYALFPRNRFLSTRLRLFIDHISAYCEKTFADIH